MGISFDSLFLASEVVFVKMHSHQQKRRAKRQDKYLQCRDDELEFSRIRYSADPEEKRALKYGGVGTA